MIVIRYNTELPKIIFSERLRTGTVYEVKLKYHIILVLGKKYANIHWHIEIQIICIFIYLHLFSFSPNYFIRFKNKQLLFEKVRNTHTVNVKKKSVDTTGLDLENFM